MSKTMALLSSETLIDDAFTLACARTEDELKEYRQQTLERLSQEGYIDPQFLEDFTCDACGRRHVCLLAYDLYSTNGDCLYEK
jgi:hypothetical protein